ncbi:hypothetical protein Anas_12968, partial [Armadillidium nasatum]
MNNFVISRIRKESLSFYFKKHSPLTYPVSTKLSRLIETGIYSKIYEKHLNRIIKNRIRNEKVDGRSRLQIGHLQTAFYALFLGCFTSLVIL